MRLSSLCLNLLAFAFQNDTILIVGLGNPGDRYCATRHNAGFLILDRVREELTLTFKEKKFGSLARHVGSAGEVFFLKPNTYVNRSGISVLHWKKKLKVGLGNIMIVTDDLSLPLGRIRLRREGSHGGHNGMKSIAEALGSFEFSRLRLGVQGVFEKGMQSEFVTSDFSPQERPVIEEGIENGLQALVVFIEKGIHAAMDQFNARRPQAPGESPSA